MKPDASKGTQLAIGIFLVWFGGTCLFVAFMSGKIAALTSTDSSGNASGPKDISGLVLALSKGVQGAETHIPQPSVGQTLPITGPNGQPVGTVTNTGGGGWIVGSSSDF